MMLQRRNRFSPFSEFRQMHNSMDRMWRDFGPWRHWPRWDNNGFNGSNGHDGWAAPLDVFTEDDNFFIRASLPGVAPEDIKVTLEDNVLTISGHTASRFENDGGSYFMRERRWGNFRRSVRLPGSVNQEMLEPRFEHGVLTITLPMAETSKAREFPVQVVEGPPAIEAS